MKQTLINLAKAFVGESQARNRYTFYSSIAKKEGYEQIGEIFALTADNEKEHASWFFKMIKEIQIKLGKENSDLIVETTVPTIKGTTLENLKAAIIGETHEYTTLYSEFAKTAENEGLKEIANRIKSIMVAEKHHAERYSKLAELLKTNSFFKRKEKIWWVCRECGYVYNGVVPPEKCPSCGHGKSFYQLLNEKY